MSARVCMCAAADVSFFFFSFFYTLLFSFFFALPKLQKQRLHFNPLSSCTADPGKDRGDRPPGLLLPLPSSLLCVLPTPRFLPLAPQKKKKWLSAKVPQVQAPETEPRTRAMNRKKGERKTTAAVVAALGNSLILLFFPAHANTHTHAGRIASVWHHRLNVSGTLSHTSRGDGERLGAVAAVGGGGAAGEGRPGVPRDFHCGPASKKKIAKPTPIGRQ